MKAAGVTAVYSPVLINAVTPFTSPRAMFFLETSAVTSSILSIVGPAGEGGSLAWLRVRPQLHRKMGEKEGEGGCEAGPRPAVINSSLSA